jgi:2,3,4,5-tetrahydropyridine-2-carboxylate N-succinyltransferase
MLMLVPWLTRATVGSCAQIGKDALSGGVDWWCLEPLQAAPVIIEDGAFIGSRCISCRRSSRR